MLLSEKNQKEFIFATCRSKQWLFRKLNSLERKFTYCLSKIKMATSANEELELQLSVYFYININENARTQHGEILIKTI